MSAIYCSCIGLSAWIAAQSVKSLISSKFTKPQHLVKEMNNKIYHVASYIFTFKEMGRLQYVSSRQVVQQYEHNNWEVMDVWFYRKEIGKVLYS